MTARHPTSRVLPVPLPDRGLRYATTLASLLNVDRWLGDAEWIYTPLEQPVTTRRPLAVTVHDLYAFEPSIPGIPKRVSSNLGWRLRMRRILNRADVIATVSNFTRSRLLELFDLNTSERIAVVGNGGSEGFSAVAQGTDEPVLEHFGLARSKYVLFPASLTRRKGADVLMKVALLARQQGAGLQFVVIGKRHEAEILAEFANTKATLSGFPVSLLGYVSREDLAVLYRHATAALFPSKYEGFGIPVIEALASGCRLLISSQPALVEIASGRAVIIDEDPARILESITVTSQQAPHLGAGTEYTWAGAASRLVGAMR
jgi:alpha-1,3-rhamnosyl/mannosyltransferase